MRKFIGLTILLLALLSSQASAFEVYGHVGSGILLEKGFASHQGYDASFKIPALRNQTSLLYSHGHTGEIYSMTTYETITAPLWKFNVVLGGGFWQSFVTNDDDNSAGAIMLQVEFPATDKITFTAHGSHSPSRDGSDFDYISGGVTIAY